MTNTNEYNDEDYNLKLYETKKKTFTQENFNTIKKRLDAYRCVEIPTKQLEELMNRLMALSMSTSSKTQKEIMNEARKKTYAQWLNKKDNPLELKEGTDKLLKGMGVHLWSDNYDIYAERRIMKVTPNFVWFAELIDNYGVGEVIKVKRDSIYGYAMTELFDYNDRGYYDMDEK